jgi:hypothetical protein
MKSKIPAAIIVAAFLLTAGLWAEKGGKSRTFLVKIKHLEMSKKKIEEGDRETRIHFKNLVRSANNALKRKIHPITRKVYVAPSGDKHDFIAYGAYAWPNPDSEDGMPWKLRDGYANPKAKIDWNRFLPMSETVEILAYAFYFTGDEKYAQRAAELLRTWFIDKKTRMNPNAEYGKVIPGKTKGGYPVAGFGYCFRRIYDSAGILDGSEHWTKKDRRQFRTWTKKFIKWALNSPYGEKERTANGNHTTFYHMIMTLQYLYVGDRTAASESLEGYKKRMRIQFTPDGKQPFEMKRVNNYDYSRCNLQIALDLAQLGDHFQRIDLWSYLNRRKGSIRKSIEFMVPYLSGKKQWDHFKRGSFKVPPVLRWQLLRRAAVGFREPAFENAAKAVKTESMEPLVFLAYPEAAIHLEK